MPVQLICTSHSPLIGYADSGMPSPSCAEAFYGLMSSLAEQVAAFDPELVLVFAPDHFNGFDYEVMPPFCIGADGEGAGDRKGVVWGKSVSVRLEPGGARMCKKKKK